MRTRAPGLGAGTPAPSPDGEQRKHRDNDGEPGGAEFADADLGELGSGFVRSAFVRMVGRRLLLAIPVLWGVTLLTFLLLNALPGDAATALLGDSATRAQLAALNAELHLNQPLWVRYGHWLQAAVTGSLGSSLANGESVTQIILQRLPVTVELVILGFIVALVIGVGGALLAARHPGSLVDRLGVALDMLGLSIAPYVLALLLVLVCAVEVRLFPALGWVPLTTSVGGNLKALALPALSLGLPLGCFYMRLYRGDILELMDGADYIVTARAKGLAPRKVLFDHGARNALFGLVTVMGLNIGILFGNTVVLETIFGLPGLGQELVQAIENRDVPVVEGIVLVFSIVVVLANLVVDLLYAMLDPRVRYAVGE